MMMMRMRKSQQHTVWLLIVFFYSGQQITCLPQTINEQQKTAELPPMDKVEEPPLIFPSINDTTVIKVNKTLTSLEELDKSSIQNQPSQQQLTKAPLIFPDENDQTSSVIKLNKSVTSLDDFKRVTDTEVDDLNKPDVKDAVEATSETYHNEDDLAKMIFTNHTFGVHNKNIIAVDKTGSDEVGLIQTGGNEDDKNNEQPQDGGGDANKGKFDSMIGERIIVDDVATNKIGGGGVSGGQIPAIIAGIFVVLCFVGYTAMLMWRRYLENKYGNREMLVNEDFYDPNDMRHFSL